MGRATPVTFEVVDYDGAMLAPDTLPGADVINRLPIDVRAAVLACLEELAELDHEGWRIALACLLAEFQIAELRAGARPH
jgi:hypothetical protein